MMLTPRDRFAVTPERIKTCIGIISDTHLPDRLTALPPIVFDIFTGVDLILHAGDVGDLVVLDQLGKIAPVVAVHGNDDSQEAIQTLPERQVIATRRTRIVLFHSHYPDHEEEMASRQIDAWEPKLDYRASKTIKAGGDIGIFGHLHIPMSVEHNGVWLINPGALASGSYATRQFHQTVAVLAIPDDGQPEVVHIDLAKPEGAFEVQYDLSAGYDQLAQKFNTTILDPDFDARFSRFWSLMAQAREPCAVAWRRVATARWEGSSEPLSTAEFLDEARKQPDIPRDLLAHIERVLA